MTDKIEAAEAGSRELDAEIAIIQNPGWRIQTDCALFPDEVRQGRIQMIGSCGWKEAPHYTTSIDAAMRLVPEGGINNMSLHWTTGLKGEPRAIARLDWFRVKARAATPALALCAAALRAKAQADG